MKSLPVGERFESLMNGLVDLLSGPTRSISRAVSYSVDQLYELLDAPPPYVTILLFTGFVYWMSRRVGLTLFSLAGMALVWNLGLWGATMRTLAMVLVATCLAILMGIPLGVLSALQQTCHRIITPVLDFMQTLPAFVYLIPAIAFFGLGLTAGIFATVVFAMPPAIRLTDLGIRQVPEELVECADAFGTTWYQKLFKVQLPLAVASIRAGVNQTIMLALSMVVIAALVGAKGLGYEVWEGVQTLDKGMAFEAGISIVIMAMILDRIMQSAGEGGRGNGASH